jgi:hypothetical protein
VYCDGPQGEAHTGLSVGVSRKQRVAERIKHGRRAGVHRQLRVINDGAHPPTFCGIGKPEFIELPTIFVIFQPQKQLVDHLVKVPLLGSQTGVVTRPVIVRQARRQFDRHASSLWRPPGLCSRCVAQSSSGQGLNRDGSRRTLYGHRFVFIRSASAMASVLCALNTPKGSNSSSLTSTNVSPLTSPQLEKRKVYGFVQASYGPPPVLEVVRSFVTAIKPRSVA